MFIKAHVERKSLTKEGKLFFRQNKDGIFNFLRLAHSKSIPANLLEKVNANRISIPEDCEIQEQINMLIQHFQRLELPEVLIYKLVIIALPYIEDDKLNARLFFEKIAMICET